MKKKKQKAYMLWENEDDSSTDSDEENEVANLCLMANIEKAAHTHLKSRLSLARPSPKRDTQHAQEKLTSSSPKQASHVWPRDFTKPNVTHSSEEQGCPHSCQVTFELGKAKSQT
ncbi:hypothetical protein PIB30_086636 [Stylosanthes scabra]|uniref:Uncharacterized protein n=1 Tax=Stylosanthes scabra TaxID=79078 RepID=A0ABU6RTT9_9FABA|nr:hypothetical protein [Stylosanthes scabra]